MNRVTACIASIPKACLRRLSTTEVKLRKPDMTHIKKKQELFQKEDGVSVYLKGGATDYFLFYLTLALTFFGVGSALHSTYKLSHSK